MFNLKYAKMAVLLGLCSFFSSACYPTGEQTLPVNDDSVVKQIEDIVSGNEHLEIDVDIPEIAIEMPKINVKVMEWNSDKLYKMFLASRPNLTYYEYPSDFFDGEIYQLYDDESSDEAYRFIVQAGFLSSQIRREFSKYGYGTMQSALDTYCFEDYFMEEGISSFSKEDAINRCAVFLKEVGITNYANPNVYAITAGKANEYWEEKNYTEYEEWTADDEIYILRFPIEYNGVPVTTTCSSSRDIGGHGGYFVGSYIDFITTEDEIIYMNCSTIFSPEYELGENVSINCSAENALKIAAEHYDSIVLGDNDIKILECELVYVPYEQYGEKNFTLIPMWRIDVSIHRGDTDIMGVCDYLFIDAQKGNIIIW